MRETRHHVESLGRDIQGLLLYFIGKDGLTFRATHLYRPYFLIRLVQNCPDNVFELIRSTLEAQFCYSDGGVNKVCRAEILEKEDLSLEDHLVGKKRKLIKISFDNNSQMRECLDKVDEYILDAEKYRGSQEERTYSLMLLKAQGRGVRKDLFIDVVESTG